MAALADYLNHEDYSGFRSGQETTLEGERVWWNNILPADSDRIKAEVVLHIDAYRRLGYRVEPSIEEDSISLHIKHKRRQVTTADLEILKGAVAATRIKAGWGGSG